MRDMCRRAIKENEVTLYVEVMKRILKPVAYQYERKW